MEMGSQSHLAAVEEEELYINMEITTPYYSNSSPQIQSKDFEFQHFSAAEESAASDLFYRGKLLRRPPLFLSAPCTTSNTPSDSYNISPSQSCRPNCDLIINPTHFTTFTFFFNNNNSQHPPINNNNNNNNNSWSNLNKRSYLAHKLKSSRAFLKSLFFTKQSSKPHDDPTPYSRFGKKLATLIKKNEIIDHHRRSFSGAIASSDSSSSSSSFNEVQFLRRRSSAAEIELSIDAAIAHCKKSYATN